MDSKHVVVGATRWLDAPKEPKEAAPASDDADPEDGQSREPEDGQSLEPEDGKSRRRSQKGERRRSSVRRLHASRLRLPG